MANEEQKKKAAPKQISITEFQMWLEGVEEMQDDDWTPDARQWKRIRAKIDAIDTASPKPTTNAPVYRGGSSGGDFPPGMEHVFPPMNTAPPSAAQSTGVMPAPSSLPPAPTIPQPMNRPVTTSSGLPVTLASGQPNIPVKTPDIDTSSGSGYASQFA